MLEEEEEGRLLELEWGEWVGEVELGWRGGQEEGLMEKRRHTGRAAAPGRWGKAEVQHGAQWSTSEERTSTDPDKTLESEDRCHKAKPSKVKSPLQTLQR